MQGAPSASYTKTGVRRTRLYRAGCEAGRSTSKSRSAVAKALTRAARFLVDVYGEPMASPSAIAVHSVIREMRGRVKCVLSGDGADELFAGYEHYAPLARLGQLRRLAPPVVSRPLASLARWLRFPQGERAARALERSRSSILDFIQQEKGFCHTRTTDWAYLWVLSSEYRM